MGLVMEVFLAQSIHIQVSEWPVRSPPQSSTRRRSSPRTGARASTLRLNRCSRRGSRCKAPRRSEEHTSELQSLMRISYSVFCLKKKHIQINDLHTPYACDKR